MHCSSYNMYNYFVHVITCTKSQLVHDIYIPDASVFRVYSPWLFWVFSSYDAYNVYTSNASFSTIIPYHLRCSDAYNVYTSNASFSTIIPYHLRCSGSGMFFSFYWYIVYYCAIHCLLLCNILFFFKRYEKIRAWYTASVKSKRQILNESIIVLILITFSKLGKDLTFFQNNNHIVPESICWFFFLSEIR